MDIRCFIGIDVSKATPDWAVFDGKKIVFQSQSLNSESGVKATVKLIKALPNFTIMGSVCCMEHTDHYTLALCCFLQQAELPYTMISPLELKRSMGLTRGKNDRVDAMRIAQFTCLHGSGRPSAAAQSSAPSLGQPSQAEKSDGLPRSAGQDRH